jgi:hypothetical protein
MMLNQSNASPATPAGFERTFRPIGAAQPGADPEYTRSTELHWIHPGVRVAVRAVMDEFLRLASVAGDMHFLQLAQERAMDSSTEAVIVALNDIRQGLLLERGAVREEVAQWNSGHAGARLKTRAFELAADDALRHAEAQLLSVRGRLTAAPAERVASQKKLRDAGLSEADIAKIGVKPSAEDVETWTAEVETLKVQIERIRKFFCTRPHFDVAMLQDADLETLARWQERLPAETNLGYRAR